MKPDHMPILKGEEAKKFIEQDSKPLNNEKKEYLKKCQKIYEKNPLR